MAVVQDAADRAVQRVLDDLDEDIRSHPENLVPMTAELLARIESLVDDVEVDLDAPNEGAVVLG